MPVLSQENVLIALLIMFLWGSIHILKIQSSTLDRIPKAHPTAGIISFWILWHRFKNTENVAVNEAHEKHGPIIRLGPKELSVNLVDGGVRTIYGKFEKHPWYHSFYNMGEPNMFTFENYHAHSERRRALSRIYSKTNLLSSSVVRMEGAAILRERLLPILSEYSESGESLEVFETMLSTTMDIVTAFQFGLEHSSKFLSDIKHRNTVLQEYNSRRPYAFYAQELQVLWRWLEKLGIHMVPKPIRTNTTSFENWILGMCESAERSIKERASKEVWTNDRTVYEQLRGSMQKFPQELSVNQHLLLGSEMADHLIAGHETSGVALTYLIYELSKNKSLQTKLRNEVRTLLKNSNQELGFICDFKSLDKLPFMHALVMEILRLYPPIAGAQARITPRDELTTLGEYKAIPGGIRVSARAYCLHRNPKIYPAPQNFKPERWLDSQGGLLTTIDAPEIHSWWWAFGSGGRICLGNNFAMHDIKLVISFIYSQFETRITDAGNMAQTDGFLGAPKGGKLMIKFSKVNQLK